MTAEPPEDQPAGEGRIKRAKRRLGIGGARVVRGSWQARVFNEARRLEGEIERVDPLPGMVDRGLASGLVRDALKLAHRHDQGWRRARLWWTGSSIEQCWSLLHGADQALLMIQNAATVAGRLGEITASVQANLPAEDGRVADYVKYIDGLQALPARRFDRTLDRERPRLRKIKGAADEASDAAHANLRAFRNLLIVVGGVAGVAAAALAIAHVIDHGVLAVCQASGSAHGCTGGADVGQIELAGSFGGTVGAVLALARSSALASPYDLPLVQALLRIPSGSLIALLGVLLVQNNVLGAFTPQSAAGLIAYAAFFGYAQEPLLRAVDRRADEVLGAARTKNDHARAPAPS